MPEEPLAGALADTAVEPVEPTEPQEPVEPAEPTEPSEPAEPSEPEPSEGEPTAEPGAQPPEVLPKDVQRALRALRQDPANATIAKSLQDSYYRDKAYSEVFNTVEDARAASATLESLGGNDGILEMRQNAQLLESLDSQIESGDPAVIDDAMESYPEGAAKLIEHGLSRLRQVSPESYDSMVRPVLIQSIFSGSFPSRIAYALEALQTGNPDFAMRQVSAMQQELNALAEEYKTLTDKSRQISAPKQDSSIADREMQLNRREVQMQAGPQLLAGIDADIGKLGKVSAEARTRIVQMVAGEIDQTLEADAGFKANMESLLRKGQTQAAARLLQAHSDRIRSTVVRSVWTQLYGQPKPAAAAPKPNGQPKPASPTNKPRTEPEADTNARPTLVARKPDDKYIDWNHPDAQLNFITGKAHLKDGRFVQWKLR